VIPTKRGEIFAGIMVIELCRFCFAKSYEYTVEDNDCDAEHPIYIPGQVSKGSSEREKTISLQAFADRLDRVISLESYWSDLSKEKPINQAQDCREAADLISSRGITRRAPI